MQVWFVQVMRQDFTVKSALKSDAFKREAHFKQRDYLSVICACIIYNLLVLKIWVSLNISLAESQQTEITAVSADTEMLCNWHELPAASNTIEKALAAYVSRP